MVMSRDDTRIAAHGRVYDKIVDVPKKQYEPRFA